MITDYDEELLLIQRRIELQERLTQALQDGEDAETKIAAAELERLELLRQHNELEIARGGLTDQQLEDRKQLNAAIAEQEKKVKQLEEAEAAYHAELERGAQIADRYMQTLFKTTGLFDQLYSNYIPKTTTEFWGLTKSLVKNIFTLNIFRVAATKLFNVFFNMAFASDKARASFQAATGAGSEFTGVLNGIRNAGQQAGVGYGEAAASLTTLYGSMSSFTELNRSEQTRLGTTTALLEQVGVAGGTTAQVLDQATKSLGMTVGESDAMLRGLKDTAISLGKPINAVVEDFARAAPKLAFYGKDMVNVFKKLEMQSKATGLSVDQILGLAGEQFDTFEGAGTAVGKLNAILGGPYLNSIDMLNASEEERMELMKGAVDASGVVFSELNKFEQKMFARALGSDVDTLRRAMGNLSAAEELQIHKQKKLEAVAAQSKDVLTQLKNALMGLIVDSKDFFDLIVVGIGKFAAFIRTLDATKVTMAAKRFIIFTLTVELRKLWGIVKFVWRAFQMLRPILQAVAVILVAYIKEHWPQIKAKIIEVGIAVFEFGKKVAQWIGAGIQYLQNMREAGYTLGEAFSHLMQKGLEAFGAKGTGGPLGTFLENLRKGKGFVDSLKTAFLTMIHDIVKDSAFETLLAGMEFLSLSGGGKLKRALPKFFGGTAYSGVGSEAFEDKLKSDETNRQRTLNARMRGLEEREPTATGAGFWDSIKGTIGASPSASAIRGHAAKATTGDPEFFKAIDKLVGADINPGKEAVNVVVKIGNKELRQEMIETLSSREAAQQFGPFATAT